MKCDDCAHYSNNGKGDEDCDLQDSWVVKKENCPDFEDRYKHMPTEKYRQDALKCVEIPKTGIGDLSDGYHTFNELYYQRCILFAQIVNDHKSRAWKTRYHEDGEPCFGGGWFLVTIDTPNGAYGYHYEDKYWDLFECEEIPKAKHWDGYTDKDVTRLFSLPEIKRIEEERNDRLNKSSLGHKDS